MWRILPILLLSLSLQAATVTNYITDGFGNPLKTRVVFTPFTISTVFGGTNVLGPSAGYPCTNGAWQVNTLGGFYYVDQGLGQPLIVIWTLPGDTQTNSLAYFASAATNPIPSFFYSGQPGPNQIFYLTNIVLVTQLITVTDLVAQVSEVFTNLWPGPTNSFNLLSGADQEYSSFTSTSITNVTNPGSNTVRTCTLTLLNLSASNETLTLGPMIETRDGLRQYTITNGQDFIISLRIHPASGRTNAVTATQF